MSFLQGWAGLILGFSGLIFIHELGHFVLAKWNGVRVYVFSLGMGPYLVSFTWRGTVYALSMIPIGGYVKLMGQDDLNPNAEPSKDKSDYRNKRPGQKAAILAAGAAFNVAFTIVAFTICYGVGMDVEPPRIGNILAKTPLSQALEKPIDKSMKERVPAQIQAGDRILEVNQVPVKTFLEAMLEISGTPNGQSLELKIERQPPGSGDVVLVYVDTKKDQKLGASSIGMDHFVEKMKLPLGFETKDYFGVLSDPGANPKTKEMPAAESGLKKHDEIVSVDGKPIYSRTEFINIIRSSEGKKLVFKIRRDKEELIKEITPRIPKDEEYYLIGANVDIFKRQVSNIDAGSAAYKAGMREGDIVIGFEPDEPNLPQWKSGKLIWRKGDSDPEKKESRITTVMTVPENSALTFEQERQAIEHYNAGSLGAAVSMAWDDTIRFSGSVFTVIKGLIRRDIGTNAVSSFIGIGGVMFTVASTQKFLNFLWFLGFISLNLGVLQFVPIPLLDGWHLLMVAVEKLKGSPVAPKIQEAFQYVGLFIVGSLLLLATYNDISRMFFQ